MFERFTESTRRIFGGMNQESLRFNHEYIGTEHILLALAHYGAGIVATAFERAGVTYDRVLIEFKEVAPYGSGMVHSDHRPPQTPAAKRVVAATVAEADALGSVDVNPEHLLLGLLTELDGAAGQMLKAMAANPSDIRLAVLDLLKSTHPN